MKHRESHPQVTGPLYEPVPPIRGDYLPFGRPAFSEAEVEAVARVLRSGWVGMGSETIAFEQELATFLGCPYVVSVSSCTAAMFLSLLTQGVGPGDEIICPSLTWCSTANVALYLGARVVFCDIDPRSYCMTADTVAAKLSSKTKAVMVVHFGGRPVDISSIQAVLPDGVFVVEDAAHALGSRFADGRMVGNSGNFTSFSFYANKNLSTGEGGAISLHDLAAAERLRSLRQHGLSADAWKRYSQPQSIIMSGLLTDLGYKMNYTDLQACIGRVQLRRQSEFHERRLEVARVYCEQLSALQPTLSFQEGVLDEGHARHLFLVEIPAQKMGLNREELILALRAANIGVTIHYAPLHRMPLYGYHESLAVTDDVCRRIMTLPISASMSTRDAEYVVAHLKRIMQQ